MISISEAITVILEQVSVIGVETVDLNSVCGRILAEKVCADMDLPPFDRSQMDGFSVKTADVESASPENPITLKIIGESAAGKGFDGELKFGETVRIMTGARVPNGADAVQRVEETRQKATDKRQKLEPEVVEILESLKVGKNITLRASEIIENEDVFDVGEKVTAEMIASLASFGYAKVKVGKRPRVSILATGNEIVPPVEKPQKDQIRDSNSIMLKTYAEKCGAVVEVSANVGDDFEKLKTAIAEAAEKSDVLILSGGVSVGDYDFTKPALRELGAEIFFEKIALRPGKPTVFAKLGACFIFGLPGNPVSVAVTFNLFARTTILKMQSATNCQMKSGFAVLGDKIKCAKGRDSYLPAKLFTDKRGSLIAEPLKWSGSSNFVGFSRAEVLVFVPRDVNLEKNEVGEILFL